jgi:activating signal cointegrator 1
MTAAEHTYTQFLQLPAISLWQPWATLIMLGEKEYETRHWQPQQLKRGQSLVIHAAKRWTKEEIEICLHEPFRSVLANHGIMDPTKQLPKGAALGVVQYMGAEPTEEIREGLGAHERAFGNYSNKRFAWRLQKLYTFDKPITVRGEQGIFSVQIPIDNGDSIASVVNFRDVKDQWDMVEQWWNNTVYVYCGRANKTYNLPESIWHNPFKGEGAIERFREYILQKPELLARLKELRGKILVCWCKPDPCHCDVLAELLESKITSAEPTKPKESDLTSRSFLLPLDVRRLGFEYDMLPAWSAQRKEYETQWVTEWKHRLLPLQIADFEKRIEEMETSLKKVQTKQAHVSRHTDEETYMQLQVEVNNLKSDIEQLSALLRADRRRYLEGLEAEGFADRYGDQPPAWLVQLKKEVEAQREYVRQHGFT